MSRTAYWSITMAAATAVLTVGGCASGDGKGAFRTADGSCQIHQSALPSTAYTGGVNGDTEAILTMMGSYTAHGTQPYCDGRPATAVDRAWSQLYVRLGGIVKSGHGKDGTAATKSSTTQDGQTVDIDPFSTT